LAKVAKKCGENVPKHRIFAAAPIGTTCRKEAKAKKTSVEIGAKSRNLAALRFDVFRSENNFSYNK
jgi:hypothetical protein